MTTRIAGENLRLRQIELRSVCLPPLALQFAKQLVYFELAHPSALSRLRDSNVVGCSRAGGCFDFAQQLLPARGESPY